MAETHGNAGDPLEPKTPLWLPAVGAVLFLTVGLIWGLSPASKEEGGTAAAGSAAPAAAADAGAPAKR